MQGTNSIFFWPKARTKASEKDISLLRKKAKTIEIFAINRTLDCHEWVLRIACGQIFVSFYLVDDWGS